MKYNKVEFFQEHFNDNDHRDKMFTILTVCLSNTINGSQCLNQLLSIPEPEHLKEMKERIPG